MTSFLVAKTWTGSGAMRKENIRSFRKAGRLAQYNDAMMADDLEPLEICRFMWARLWFDAGSGLCQRYRMAAGMFCMSW